MLTLIVNSKYNLTGVFESISSMGVYIRNLSDYISSWHYFVVCWCWLTAVKIILDSLKLTLPEQIFTPGAYLSFVVNCLHSIETWRMINQRLSLQH